MQPNDKLIDWEKEVNWKNVEKGLLKYNFIMKYFHSNSTATMDWTNDDFINFKRHYNGFYRVRRNENFQKEYFQLMFEKDRSRQFQQVLESIKEKTNRIEASFASKLLHTINAEMPIWDSIILGQIKVKPPYYSASNRLQAAIDCYKRIEDWYSSKLPSDEGREMISLFDSKFPHNEISDVKKIDFMLWQINRD